MIASQATQTEPLEEPQPRLLRIGILLDSAVVPTWIYSAIERLQTSEGISLTLIYLNTTARHRLKADESKTLRDHAFAAYRAIDRFVFSRRLSHDALRPVNMSELPRDVMTLDVPTFPNGSADRLRDADVESIRACKLDLLVHFGERVITGLILRAATYGVMLVRHGEESYYRAGPELFWEMYAQNPVSGTRIQILGDNKADAKVVFKTYSATHPYSLLLNRNEIHWKTGSVLTRKILELRDKGAAALQPTEQAAVLTSNQAPGLLQLAGFAIRSARNLLQAQYRARLCREHWFLAVAARLPGTDGLIGKHGPFQFIRPPAGHFYADPCIVSHDGHEYIFYEDYVFSKLEGRLGCIEIDPASGAVLRNETIIEEAFHLSYPFAFEIDGTFYLIPESVADHSIRLYRAEQFPWKWTLDSILLDGINAVDSTIHRQDGLFWLFANIAASGASTLDELYLFYATDIRGPWSPHPQNPIISDVRRARPAGRLFRQGNSLYRPSQNCSLSYGKSIVINEVQVLSRTEYKETAVSEVQADWISKQTLRTHTLTMDERFVVTDGFIFARK